MPDQTLQPNGKSMNGSFNFGMVNTAQIFDEKNRTMGDEK